MGSKAKSGAGEQALKAAGKVITFDPGGFARIVGSVSVACDDDTFRPHLNSVSFQVKAGKLSVAATNGHWLALWEQDADFAPDCSTLIPLHVIKEALRMSKTLGSVAIDTEACTIESLWMTLRYAKLDVEFPPIRKVIPAVNPGRTPREGFGVWGLLMARVCEVFKRAGKGKANGASFFVEVPEKHDDALVFSSEATPELTVVLMPNRVERSSGRILKAASSEAPKASTAAQ